MSPAYPTLMISPCGTSLFTNGASDDDRRLLIENANSSEGEIAHHDLERLQIIIEKASNKLQNASFKDICKHTAELHTISRYYQMGESLHQRDIHILLASDTWLGKQAAKLVQKWLKNHIPNVQVEKRADLTTNDLRQFHSAMTDLVIYFEEHLPAYREAGYHIVFNLTGGFKGVQGFLQTLAMFYADEAIYIFQSGSELLRLPSLPIEMKTEHEVQENLRIFRRLSMNLPTNEEEIQPISEMFFIEIDGEYALSPWGELTWSHTKKKIYLEKVWESPHHQIRLTKSFRESVRNLDSQRYKKINERIDDLMLYVVEGENLKGLHFKKWPNNPVSGSTHQFNVGSNSDASRVFCHYEGDTIVLDKLGDHL